MRVVLLNSAMMPTPDLTYRPRKVAADEFVSYLRRALDDGAQVDSYIGYESTIELINRLVGWKPPLSREESYVRPGDVILVARLRYRVKDPNMKRDENFQKQLDVDDMEFLIVEVE